MKNVTGAIRRSKLFDNTVVRTDQTPVPLSRVGCSYERREIGLSTIEPTVRGHARGATLSQNSAKPLICKGPRGGLPSTIN